MTYELLLTLSLPFLGTLLGSASVFFLKGQLNPTVQRSLLGFAAGVMVAASVWSLIIPAMEQSEHLGKLAFMPALVGLWLGFLFLLILDRVIPHLHPNGDCPDGVCCPSNKADRSKMLFFAVALHNLPEGMAVGVAVAGWLSGEVIISSAAALALAVGIAIQNIPEGAIISLPMRSNGLSRKKAFAYGTASGIIEPIGTVLTIVLAGLFVPILPYLLAFSAGAMLYVVVEELIPEMSAGEHASIGTIFFAIGFSLMMVLDIALG